MIVDLTLLGHQTPHSKNIFFSPSCTIYYYATWDKKVYFASVKFDARENQTSKINVFPVSHTIFFLLGGQKMDLFAPHGAIKSTLLPASRKNTFGSIHSCYIKK